MARLWNSKRRKRVAALVLVLSGVVALSLPLACRQRKTHAHAPEIDSKNLKQTVVVATLDCPLPEHKNAIWCATFQMAWDKFKQDIIGEPIQVLGAEELANRLNAGPFPTGSIEEKSYYAVAGFVKKGIIEQVQKEMATRFPSEPAPTFDSRDRTLPDVALAYAYLNVDIGFRYPYHVYQGRLNFLNSSGMGADVTAFCAQTNGPARDTRHVRDQVEVLYYDSGGSSGAEQFAVDLSRETQPYQVVLACTPRCNTLGETARMLQERISVFKKEANYEALRKLGSRDTLIVPDVLYKLTHRFDELLDKNFGNRKWSDYFFFEALQKIDFTLSRTGVVLKSHAHLKAAAAAKPEPPRHLHFDRPFLICVQKREPNATPFFLMWVDNAELMKPYAAGDQGS